MHHMTTLDLPTISSRAAARAALAADVDAFLDAGGRICVIEAESFVQRISKIKLPKSMTIKDNRKKWSADK